MGMQQIMKRNEHQQTTFGLRNIITILNKKNFTVK